MPTIVAVMVRGAFTAITSKPKAYASTVRLTCRLAGTERLSCLHSVQLFTLLTMQQKPKPKIRQTLSKYEQKKLRAKAQGLLTIIAAASKGSQVLEALNSVQVWPKTCEPFQWVNAAATARMRALRDESGEVHRVYTCSDATLNQYL